MKFFVLFAIIGLSVAANIRLDEDDLENENIQTQGFISKSASRIVLDKLSKQMPVGWPEYGIPPLAPFTVSELQISKNINLFSTDTGITKLSVNGLDNFNVNDAQMNMFKKKINLDITFPVLNISAPEYHTQNVIDALEELGVKVQLVAAGGLELVLENVRVQLRVKYSIPVLWGSNKVKSLDTYVTSEKATANFENLLGNGKLNQFVNRLISEQVNIALLNNEDVISGVVSDFIIPKVNKALKGSDLWTIIKKLFGN